MGPMKNSGIKARLGRRYVKLSQSRAELDQMALCADHVGHSFEDLRVMSPFLY